MMEKPENQKPVPQIPRRAIHLLSYCDFWDGPLSGLCLYQGQRYWYEAIAPEKNNYDYPRKMGVYTLSTEELQTEEESDRRFQEEKLGKFYSWYKQQPRRDYRHNEMVGWFEL